VNISTTVLWPIEITITEVGMFRVGYLYCYVQNIGNISTIIKTLTANLIYNSKLKRSRLKWLYFY